MPRVLTKARLARAIGVSKQRLNHHVQTSLADACSDAGVDLDHPATVAWLLGRFDLTPDEVVARDGGAPPVQIGRPARAPTRTLETPVTVCSDPTTPPTSTSSTPIAARETDHASQHTPFALHEPPDVEGLYRLTFAEIVARFAHLEGFESWLDARKRAAEIRRLELGNARTEAQLIPRDFVTKHVLGHLEALHRKLLTDAARTIAGSVMSAVRAGDTVERVEQITRELIGLHLNQATSDVARAVRSTAVGDDRQGTPRGQA
jgi:hypothetical protein